MHLVVVVLILVQDVQACSDLHQFCCVRGKEVCYTLYMDMEDLRMFYSPTMYYTTIVWASKPLISETNVHSSWIQMRRSFYFYQ